MEKPKILKKHYILQWFRASGHVELGPKIIKNRADVFQKVASKTMLQLGSILEPTWLDFGRVLAPKFGPNWSQVALKMDPKSDQKTDHILDRFWNDFTGFWPPTWGSQRGPRTDFLESCWLLVPSWGQDGPKRASGTDFG